ncbi:MAG: 3-keto-5-aminohexanoate cleavage protein, partial [Mesorhizobium sp.]
QVLRILIEISEQELDEALEVCDGIAAVLDRAGMHRAILLHGADATVWPFVKRAAERHWSTRVGLEDGRQLPDGTTASGNAALTAAAAAIFRAGR